MECSQCGATLTGSPRFCPSCGNPVVSGGAPAAGASAGTRGRSRKVGLVLFPVVLAAGIGLFYAYLTPSMHPVIKNQPVVASPAAYDSSGVTMTTIPFREEGGDIVFSLEDVRRFRLIRFEVQTATTVRPVLAYLGPDGRLVTAISVSEHCGSTEFVLRNSEIDCARCPSRWDMMTMEAYACCAKYYPDPIPSRVENGEVRIPRVYVEKWAGRL
jgi:uncharacterized protein